MPSPSVELYTQHLTEAGTVRASIAAMKAALDSAATRQALINLNSVEANLLALPYPTDLVGRVEALSQAIQGLETTLSAIEDAIRGAALYPVQ
jgi:hypothetical protein